MNDSQGTALLGQTRMPVFLAFSLANYQVFNTQRNSEGKPPQLYPEPILGWL